MAVLGEARQKRERKRWEVVLVFTDSFQGETLAVVIIYFLRLVREQKNRVSKVVFMDTTWISHENCRHQITSTFILCAYPQKLLKNVKVLLDGVYDEDSLLHTLRAPNNVVEDVMPIVWVYLTRDWQVGLEHHVLAL